MAASTPAKGTYSHTNIKKKEANMSNNHAPPGNTKNANSNGKTNDITALNSPNLGLAPVYFKM